MGNLIKSYKLFEDFHSKYYTKKSETEILEDEVKNKKLVQAFIGNDVETVYKALVKGNSFSEEVLIPFLLRNNLINDTRFSIYIDKILAGRQSPSAIRLSNEWGYIDGVLKVFDIFYRRSGEYNIPYKQEETHDVFAVLHNIKNTEIFERLSDKYPIQYLMKFFAGYIVNTFAVTTIIKHHPELKYDDFPYEIVESIIFSLKTENEFKLIDKFISELPLDRQMAIQTRIQNKNKMKELSNTDVKLSDLSNDDKRKLLKTLYSDNDLGNLNVNLSKQSASISLNDSAYIGYLDGVIDAINRGVKQPALNTAFKSAVMNNHIEIIKYLVDKNMVQPNIDDDYAFQSSARSRNAELMSYLLSKPSVNPSARDNYAFKELFNGFTYRDTEKCIKLLLSDNRIDPTSQKNYALRMCAKHGDEYLKYGKLLLNDKRIIDSLTASELLKYQQIFN